MTRRGLQTVLRVAMLGALLLATAGSAQAVLPSVLLTPVAAAEADAQTARSIDASLRAAFEAAEGLAVASAAPLAGERTASHFRAWAEQVGADALLAASLADGSLRLELRSGHSGGVISDWSVEASALDLQPIVRESQLVLESQRGTDEVADDAVGDGSESDDSVLGGLRTDGPIAIRSDQLDVATKDGERHLVFRDNVVAEQGDIELHASKLDAFYAEGESEPKRLVAHGEVEVHQADRVAYCDVATYLRSDQTIVCKGHARLVQGCDVVRGEQLEFDLEREHFRVTGAASVLIGEGEEVCPPSSQTEHVEPMEAGL